jgi:hypothetical protein
LTRLRFSERAEAVADGHAVRQFRRRASIRAMP